MGGCVGRELPDFRVEGEYMTGLRDGGMNKYLFIALKDTEICISMPNKEAGLIEALDDVMLDGCPSAKKHSDVHGMMWDQSWKNASLTMPPSYFSFEKPSIPNGRMVVKLLDVLAEFGWTMADGPSFGGNPGNTQESIPVFIFRKDETKRYSNESLIITMDDSREPGKLFAAGPERIIRELETSLLGCLAESNPGLVVDRDSQPELWDTTWKNVSVTAGSYYQGLSYFPRGKTVQSIIEESYNLGCRLVGAPSFSGDNTNWPCLIFRVLQDTPHRKSPVLVVGIQEQGGRICFAGPSDEECANAVLEGFKPLVGNANIALNTEGDDLEWGRVLINATVTTGATKAGGRDYFPRNDAIMTMLRILSFHGWCTVGCMNYSGSSAVWPLFIFEKRWGRAEPGFVAIMEDTENGKVCIGGAQDAAESILMGFKKLNGDAVCRGDDETDTESYDVCFTNTVMSTDSRWMVVEGSWWPHGYPLEMLLNNLYEAGFQVVGGPNFGSHKTSWSTFVLERRMFGSVTNNSVR